MVVYWHDTCRENIARSPLRSTGPAPFPIAAKYFGPTFGVGYDVHHSHAHSSQIHRTYTVPNRRQVFWTHVRGRLRSHTLILLTPSSHALFSHPLLTPSLLTPSLHWYTHILLSLEGGEILFYPPILFQVGDACEVDHRWWPAHTNEGVRGCSWHGFLEHVGVDESCTDIFIQLYKYLFESRNDWTHEICMHEYLRMRMRVCVCLSVSVCVCVWCMRVSGCLWDAAPAGEYMEV